MSPRHCLQCGMPDVLPNSDYCRHCLMGEMIIAAGGKFMVAFGIGLVAALVSWCMS